MRSKTIAGITACIIVLCAAGARAQDAGTTGGQAAGASGPDQTFVTQAVRANDREIDQAQAELSSPNASPSVKMYAQQIVNDHSTANSQLAAIAKSLNLSYPQSHIAEAPAGTNPSPAPAQNRANPMEAMPAKSYMSQQVQAHQQAIALYEGEAKNGGSEQLRAYAAQTLPALKSHLAMAQQYVASGTISPHPTPTPPG